MENKRIRQSYDTTSMVRKGAWTAEEDILLKDCVEKFGEGKWQLVPLRAGLNRCRKSCRLRWLNYLRPNIKKGDFEEDEVDLMLRLHKLLGNRWALIAGRIPGRTANDVKNYWNTHFKPRPKQHKKQLKEQHKEQRKDGERFEQAMVRAIKPKPCTISKALNLCPPITSHNTHNLMTSSNIDGTNNVFSISPDVVLSPTLTFDNINEYLDDDWGKEIGDGLNVVEQVDGQNSLFDFSIDDVVMFDLVNGEQL